MLKEHFKNLLEDSPKLYDKPITNIINWILDIKLGQFTEEKVNVVLTKIRSRKYAVFDEIPAEVWKTRKFDDLRLRFCNILHKQNIIER